MFDFSPPTDSCDVAERGFRVDSNRQTAVVLGLITAVWTVPGLLCAVQMYAEAVVRYGADFSIPHILAYSLPVWWVWVPLTFLIAGIARRFPFASGRQMASAAVHLLAGVGVAGGHLFLYALWIGVAAPYDVQPSVIDRTIGWMDDLWVQLNLFLYALIAGVTYAFDAQASLRANQLRRSQLEAQLNDARLQALKAQLQPHFLFNTLGAIQTLVLRHGANDAAQMISRLSEYLRTTLDDDVRQEVPLAVEIEGTNQYLSIETCRFGDRLVVEQSIDPDARAILVPHLVLQPIVENAIRHGFAAVRGPVHLWIDASVHEGELLLTVEDDGAGPNASPPTDYAAPSMDGVDPHSPAGADNSQPGGRGLSTSRARLNELYGDRSSLTTKPRDPSGFVVQIRLPARTDADARARTGRHITGSPGNGSSQRQPAALMYSPKETPPSNASHPDYGTPDT
jgi:two-component system, LytTR family, sensor kinase